MKKLVLIVVGMMTAVSAAAANGQDKEPAEKNSTTIASNRLPDWQSSYQQEMARDYIRRRAQEKSAARQARIEGMKWLGYSPARPVVSTTPFMSSPPSWVSVSPWGYWGYSPHSQGWLP